MRSALTDPPVASFTTLSLRTTQHATGLMVKVAPLLPSRDLLSSQRQLTWTHTIVFAITGGDGRAISSKSLLSYSYRGDGILLAIKCIFNKIFSIKHLYGLDDQ
jgi:hypothetical protein